MSSPESPTSGIEQAQRDRAIVDAIVQAGLSARMAYSLVGGMVGAAQQAGATEAVDLIEEAQQRADGVKNADMSLDHAIAADGPGGDELREAAHALEQAAKAYRTAAKLHEAVDAVEGGG